MNNSTIKSDDDSKGADFKGRMGWMLFDWAAQPYFTLILTFIFAPYFTSAFIGDDVSGQSYWSLVLVISGVILAVMSPIFGSIADRMGPRKPWIFAFSVIFVIGSSLLWFAVPGDDSVITLIMVGLVLAAIGIEFAGVFNNALLPTVAGKGKIGKLSGNGWALGYVGGLVTLVIILGFLSTSTETGKTMLGFSSLLGFDPELKEADRFVGPLAAMWYVIFVVPMFLFTPDEKPSQYAQAPVMENVKNGVKDLWAVLKDIRKEKNIFAFFIARMIYFDGITALFAFGGIYATFAFGWDITTLGIFGIILSIAAALGAFLGGIFDDIFGPKKVIMFSLFGLVVSALGILSISETSALLFITLPPIAENSGLFGSLGEQIMLIFGIGIGIFAGPAQAASRTMLVNIIPEGQNAKYFGLFALSGKATTFAAPAIILALTLQFEDYRMSMVTILGFLIVGIILFTKVSSTRSSA